MLTSPYSIYVKKRPLRVAFFVEDTPDSMAIIETILEHNRERWGGRYNLVVLTDGQTLTDAWWAFLELVDPDVVKAYVTLGDNLLAQIERRISPYLILQPDPREQEADYRRIELPDPGLSLLPTARNVRMASWAALAQPILVLFNTHWKGTDPLIKRFTEWNFGDYSHPVHTVARALEDVRTQPYEVTDAASLAAPLRELSDFRPFTYPIQLCSLPAEAVPPVARGRFDETFHVVIGDSPKDVAYFWNRPATTPQWSRTYLNQVWLPLPVAQDPQLTTALSSWLQRAADPNGSGRGRIRFVSLSLSSAQLRDVVEPLTRELRVFRSVDVLPDIEPPGNGAHLPGPLGLDGMDLYRVTGTIERITLQEPEIATVYHGEHWMADLYIEFRPERYPTISGRTLWWQLPRHNDLAAHRMFQRSARILKSRYPSVLMKRGEPRLDITLPDDLNIFTGLAAWPNQPRSLRDARYGKVLPGRKPYYRAQRSEKGRYLSGLLDLFDGLHPASHILEMRYWRRIFDLLSGRSAHTDAERLERVGNALRKRLGANSASFYENDKAMEWLTNYVIQVARSLPASSRDLGFRVFEEQARQELGDFNAIRPAGQEPWEYSQEDLLDALAGLTERGVLLMGMKARCPSCGYRDWHHIDDARQTLRCGGCNAEFPMPPEPRWYYRLNSLARAAHAQHGLLPVVLVLGQLLMTARNAFLFAPCLDLFEDNKEGPIGDLDIAVILDGEFVIGEVKQSTNLFDEAAFTKMEAIARRLLPDVLLFASMDPEPTRLISEQVKRLSATLAPEKIAVRWYQLHDSTFAPSPVR